MHRLDLQTIPDQMSKSLAQACCGATLEAVWANLHVAAPPQQEDAVRDGGATVQKLAGRLIRLVMWNGDWRVRQAIGRELGDLGMCMLHTLDS